MSRVEVDERFLIHREAPDDPRGHLCEPRMTRTPDGRIFLSFRTGTLRYSADGSPRLLTSADEGRTWEDLGRVLDGALPGQPGWDYRALALTELADGELLGVSVGLDRASHGKEAWLVYNPDPAFYQGMIPIRNWVSRSADGGRTWAPPWPMEGMTVRNSSAQVLVRTASGSVLTPLETFKDFDEAGPWRYRVDMIRTHDGGVTWGESAPAHMSDAEDPRHLMCWDPRMSLLPDGRIVQTYYAFLNGTGGEDPIHIGWSTDEGRTWSVPRSIGIVGQAMFPIALPSGGVIGFFQRRKGDQGVIAVHSPGRRRDVAGRRRSITGDDGVPARSAVGAGIRRGRRRGPVHERHDPLHVRPPHGRGAGPGSRARGLVRRRRDPHRDLGRVPAGRVGEPRGRGTPRAPGHSAASRSAREAGFPHPIAAAGSAAARPESPFLTISQHGRSVRASAGVDRPDFLTITPCLPVRGAQRGQIRRAPVD